MKQCTFTGWIVMAFLCGKCFAADPMEESAAKLASALGISTNNQTNISSSTPVFSAKQTVKAGEFQVRQKRMKESPPATLVDVDILDVNDQVVATGRIIESASFEMARKALLEKLVLNSMPIAMLIDKYEVPQNDVGDLCIVEKTFDKTTRTYSSVPAAIHFVRGCTAVSLCPVAKSKDIHDIAKALDAVLSEMSKGKGVGLLISNTRLVIGRGLENRQ